MLSASSPLRAWSRTKRSCLTSQFAGIWAPGLVGEEGEVALGLATLVGVLGDEAIVFLLGSGLVLQYLEDWMDHSVLERLCVSGTVD